MLVRSVLSLSLVSTLLACGDAQQRRESQPPAAAPTAVPAAASAEPASSPVRPTRPAVPAAVRTAHARSLREGRALARRGDFRGALTELESAMTSNPDNARLRCEAGYVAYRAGDLDKADLYVRRALAALPPADRVPAPLRNPVAMCLYNAGLVQSARNDAAAARESFARSLALRENATVRAKLEALGAAAAVAPSPSEARAYVLEELCALRDAEEDTPCAVETNPDGRSLTLVEQRPTGTLPPGMSAVAVVGTLSELGEYVVVALEVRRGSDVRVAQMATSESPGVGGVTGEASIKRFEALDLIPGGATELVFEIASNQTDTDLGDCAEYGGDARELIVCGVLDDALACAGITLVDTTYSEVFEDCELWSGEMAEASSERAGYALSASFRNGTLTLDPVRGAPHTEGPRLPRARTVEAWLRDPLARWPSAR